MDVYEWIPAQVEEKALPNFRKQSQTKGHSASEWRTRRTTEFPFEEHLRKELNAVLDFQRDFIHELSKNIIFVN